MTSTDIAITGIGTVTPHGLDSDSFFEAISSGVPCEQGVFAQCIDGAVYINDRKFLNQRKSDNRKRIGKDHRRAFVLEAACRALDDAGIDDLTGIGCTISCARPTLGRAQRWYNAISCLRRGEESSDFNVPIAGSVEIPGTYVMKQLGIDGPSLAVSGGCTTGLLSVLAGCRIIIQGQAQRVIAGAVEVVPERAFMAGYRSMKVLTDSYEHFRPFHRHRNGFFIAEGAGIVILESADSARSRGRIPYATVENWCSLCDPTGMTSMNTEGSVIKELISRLTDHCSVPVDYVNCHGTGTIMNDRAESKAIAESFGVRRSDVSCSSIKGQTGHMLGVSSIIELIATTLAVKHDIVPPTIRLDDTDIAYGLDYTPIEPRTRTVNRAISLSYGFGGAMSAILLAKPD